MTIERRPILIGVGIGLLLTWAVDKAAEMLLVAPETADFFLKADPIYLVLSGYFMKYNILRIIVCGAIPGYIAARYSKSNKILYGFLAAFGSQMIYIYFHEFNFIRKHEIAIAYPLLLTLVAAAAGGLIAKTIETKRIAI